MQITVRMDVRPWSAPNYVLCVVAGKETSAPLSEAGPDVVRELVKAWLSDVYTKAGLQPDWRFE